MNAYTYVCVGYTYTPFRRLKFSTSYLLRGLNCQCVRSKAKAKAKPKKAIKKAKKKAKKAEGGEKKSKKEHDWNTEHVSEHFEARVGGCRRSFDLESR